MNYLEGRNCLKWFGMKNLNIWKEREVKISRKDNKKEAKKYKKYVFNTSID